MSHGRDKHTSKHTAPTKIHVAHSTLCESTKVKSGRCTLQLISALAALFLLLVPICLPSPDSGAHAAGQPNDTIGEESLIQQIAEQDKVIPDALDGAELSDGLANGTGVWPTPPTTDSDSTIKWLIQAPGEVVANTIPGAAEFLVAFLRDFVLNPNIAIDGVGQTDNGLGRLVAAISPQIKAVSQIMYAIAIDLLLLLFILSIWRYWVEAAWRGGGNHFAPIARLIFTAGIITAWPTIYAFEVELTNEMIHAIFFRTQPELDQLSHAVNIAIAGAISALVGLALQVIGPLVGTLAALPLGPFGPMLGGLIGFVGGILFMIPGTIIILELVAIIVLKSIQTCVLIAQYMFAPVFLVFFASPDTEYIPKTFVKSFIEVSMWTFVWVGLLRILVIVMNSNVELWAEILLVIGVLQMMLSAPEFMGRAHISPASELLTAGLIIRGLSKGAQGLGGLANDSLQAFSKMTARGQIGGQRNTGAATTAGIAAAAFTGTGSTTPPIPGTTPTPPVTGTTPPATGTTPPFTGTTPPVTGTTPPVTGTTPPVTGTTPPVTGTTPPVTGTTPPVTGTTPPVTGTTPPVTGTTPPVTGTTPPVTGTTPPITGTTPPVTGTTPPVTTGRAMAIAAGAESLLIPPGTDVQPGNLSAMQHSNWTGRNMMGAFLRVFGAKSLYGLGIRFGPSPDNNAHFEADPRTGEITNMNTPTADPADRDEAGRIKPNSPSAKREAGWRLVAGMANHVALDSTEGKEAARQAAISRGAMRPQNLQEKLMEATLRANGQRFEDTDLAKQHLAQAMHEQTVGGIQSYLNGQQGNQVTDYFRATHGENRAGLSVGNGITQKQVDEGNAFQPMMQNLLSRESDSRNPDSGINPDQRGMSGLLDSNGYQPNNLTRAIAANAALRQLPKGLQRAAFEGAYECMTGIQATADTQRRQQQAASGQPVTGLTEDEVIDLWHETAPFFAESRVRAMMSMRSAGVSTSNPQLVQDVAEIGQALGGAIPAYTSAVGLGVGLASSLGPLRSTLAANPLTNGATLGELVVKCTGNGADLRVPEIMQSVILDVQNNVPIDSQRVSAMTTIHNSGASLSNRQMVADVATIGHALGDRPADYGTAIDIQKDWGNLTPHLGQGQLANVPNLGALVVHSRNNGVNLNVPAARAGVAELVIHDQPVNEQTCAAINAVVRYAPANTNLRSAGNLSAIADLGAADGGRPQNYTNAIHVLESSAAIGQGIPSNVAGPDDIRGVVTQIHKGGGNVQHPQVQSVIHETLLNNPQMFQDSARRETVVKGIVLAANNVPPQSLQASDVTIAMSVAAEATQAHFNQNNPQISSRIPNTMAALSHLLDSNAPNSQVNAAQAERNLNLADRAMRNIRDDLMGRRPPRQGR